jgi:hypothetical protein
MKKKLVTFSFNAKANPFVEASSDSLKKGVNEKDAELQKIKIDDVTYMVAPKNMKVAYDYSEKPKETPQNLFMVDPPILILNAHSYFAWTSETVIRINGNDNSTYMVGTAVEFPFYDNQIITFNQNYSVIDTCSLSPVYPLAKFSKMSYFYMMTPDTTRSAACEMMRQMVVTNGEPYIGTVFYLAPVGLPVYDWIFIASYYLNAQGNYTNSPSPAIGAIAIPREWLWPQNHNHLEYLVFGLLATTDIWDYQNQQNQNYTSKGSSMGAYTLDQFGVPIPYHECAWVESAIIGINPICGEVPSKFSLSQNYPNPFNPTTTIKFDIPKSSEVKISIYDITGKELEVLVNEKLQAGTYQTTWNASNFSSGVYFYRLQTEDFSETKKLILLK